MASGDPRTRRHALDRGGLLVAFLIAVALASAFSVSMTSAGASAFEHRAALSLRELGTLAGLRDSRGRMSVEHPLPVTVVQEGGPLWLSSALAEAARHDPVFDPVDGPHVLQAEVVGASHLLAVRLELTRQGWSLQMPQPIRIRMSPWIVVLAGVLGALSLRWLRRIGPALLLAGGLGQALLAAAELWQPFPAPLRPRGVLEAMKDGLAAELARGWADALPDTAAALGAGIVALCLVLMVFDHRRSRGRSPTLLLHATAGIVGTLALLEAALRTGADGAVSTLPGLVSVTCLIGLWVMMGRAFARHRAISKHPESR